MGIHFRPVPQVDSLQMSPGILVSSKDPHIRDAETKAQGGLFDQYCSVGKAQLLLSPQGGLQLVRIWGG